MAGRDKISIQSDGASLQLERQLDALERMASVFSLMHRGQDIYEHVCQQAAELLGTHMCAVLLYEPGREELVGHVPAVGVSDEHMRAYRVPVGPGSPVRDLWAGGGFFCSDDVSSDPLVQALGLDDFARKVGVRQTLMVGIRLEGELIGIIQPSNKRDGTPFNESDVRLLSIYASQVAVAIANQQLYQATLAERDKLSRLHQVALAVQRAPSLSAKLRRIGEGIRETWWQRVIISLRDEAMRVTELISVGLSEEEERQLAQRALPPEAWQRRLDGGCEPFRIGMSYFVPAEGQPPQGERWRPGDELFIPVRDQTGRVVCIINLEWPLDGRRPTAESLRIIELFAQEAAANIETAQLYQALQDQIIVLGERAQRLALLNRISSLLGSTLDLQTLLSHVSQHIVEAFGVDHCNITLYDTESQVVHCVVEHPALGMVQYSMSVAGYSLVERLRATARPVEIDVLAAGDDLLGQGLRQWLARFEVESTLIVPLSVQGRLVGWIGLDFIRRKRSLSADQVELCQTIANQTAAAVENARLFERVQSTLHELEATNRTQAQLLATVQELSTPVVPVMEGILILPLIGFIDSDRAQRIMEGLLAGIEQYRAKVVLVDVTGVPVVDSGVAEHLMRTARAALLLGARPILVGIRPEVAQTIVGLGVHLRDLVTRSDMQSGLEYALAITRRKIVTVDEQ